MSFARRDADRRRWAKDWRSRHVLNSTEYRAAADNRATLKALAVAEVLQGRSERPEAPVHKPATRRLPEVVAVT